MIDPKYLDAIKRFEGFTAKASWDYAQSTNGYGTRARFDGEVIDTAEAERRFKSEISSAFEIVQRFAPDLDDGTKAALTSLTFNAGPSWTRSGLGKAIQAGDLEAARAIFQKYNRAGGKELAGLTSRRVAEAAWFTSASPHSTQIAATTLPAPASLPLDDPRTTALVGRQTRNTFVSSATPRSDALSSIEIVPTRAPLTLNSMFVLLALIAESTSTTDDSDKTRDDKRFSDQLLAMRV